MQQNDETQDPDTPQFPFAPTASEAATHQQLVRSPLEGPGDIVQRLGLQFTLPRAQPDSEMSRNEGTPYG